MFKIIATIVLIVLLVTALIIDFLIKKKKIDVSRWDRVPKDTKSMEERIREYDEFLASQQQEEDEINNDYAYGENEE